jgi:hypothetical protein
MFDWMKQKPCNDCTTARERADQAVRAVKELGLEFETLQDYVKRMAARVTRRDHREEQAVDQEAAQTVSGPTGAAPRSVPRLSFQERLALAKSLRRARAV